VCMETQDTQVCRIYLLDLRLKVVVDLCMSACYYNALVTLGTICLPLGF